MQAIIDFVKREPAIVVTVFLALVELAASFGFNVTDRQTSAITAILTVAAGVLVRANVTPVTAPVVPAAKAP